VLEIGHETLEKKCIKLLQTLPIAHSGLQHNLNKAREYIYIQRSKVLREAKRKVRNRPKESLEMLKMEDMYFPAEMAAIQ
jgi:hypothetical protein